MLAAAARLQRLQTIFYCACDPNVQDSDHCALLARETVQGGHSVLVFCGTKQGCEVTAKRAARWEAVGIAANSITSCHWPALSVSQGMVHNGGASTFLWSVRRMIDIPERQLRLKDYASSQRPSRTSLLEELRRVPGGADPGLLECVARGAAFHHAGGFGARLHRWACSIDMLNTPLRVTAFSSCRQDCLQMLQAAAAPAAATVVFLTSPQLGCCRPERGGARHCGACLPLRGSKR